MNGMMYDGLPDTFKHAVQVTRALGLPYLWIDSICIIQGQGGDFDQEAKRMEQVYRGAYCVIASSRAAGHYAGFLKPRETRDIVTFCQKDGDAPFFICDHIDDFNAHVLKGGLSQRGWVLQEHALARRTIYFTDHQMYFECGGGVRCETMMTMNKSVFALILASLRLDPSTPEYTLAPK